MNNEARKIKQALNQFKGELDNMVTIMGNDAINHFKDSFTNQGFTDDSLDKWKPRKRAERKRTTRAILVKTGRLKRSLTKRQVDRLSVRVSSNVPYALRHNEGLSRMPKRQFVGYSRKLNDQLKQKFDRKIRKIFE